MTTITPTTIRANNTATKRTKELLREHGDTYKIKETRYPSCFNGRKAVLAESQTTMYLMWLLCDDIVMEEGK